MQCKAWISHSLNTNGMYKDLSAGFNEFPQTNQIFVEIQRSTLYRTDTSEQALMPSDDDINKIRNISLYTDGFVDCYLLMRRAIFEISAATGLRCCNLYDLKDSDVRIICLVLIFFLNP